MRAIAPGGEGIFGESDRAGGEGVFRERASVVHAARDFSPHVARVAAGGV